MSTLTITALSALTMGLAAVIWTTWRNSRATGTIGQLLYRTEQPPAAGQKIDPRRFQNDRTIE